MRARLLIIIAAGSLAAHAKRDNITQQFSQDFLSTVHNDMPAQTTHSNLALLDQLYAQKPSQQSLNTVIYIQEISHWKLKLGLTLLVTAWCLFKCHQGLSFVVGEKYSAAIFKQFFLSVYHTLFWLIKKIGTDCIAMSHYIVPLDQGD